MMKKIDEVSGLDRVNATWCDKGDIAISDYNFGILVDKIDEIVRAVNKLAAEKPEASDD